MSFYEQFEEKKIELRFPEQVNENEENYLIFSVKSPSRTNTESSGLGLYLSKKLAEKMNGKMDAELNDTWFILNVHLPINRIDTEEGDHPDGYVRRFPHRVP